MKARKIKQDMDDLSVAILAHSAREPDDFDGREELWMQRENLRYQLELDTATQPSWIERVAVFFLGHKQGAPALGAVLVIFTVHPA